jgi:hypothetical protein
VRIHAEMMMMSHFKNVLIFKASEKDNPLSARRDLLDIVLAEFFRKNDGGLARLSGI